ncbi:MAG TPA: PP2C family protein-serine/threonine phosphatase [Gemmataceae bacterium]|nr:PP2C family protein-serine/threonine phosphatase [Gemmataceae bacterium]
MKILVGWDDPQEAHLLELYFSAGDNEAKVCLTADELKAGARTGGWEVLFLAMTFGGGADAGYAAFAELQEDPNPLPVVLGCRSTEMIGLVKFLTHGLRFYLIRDDRGDFVFLALSSLESAVAAVRAERAKQLAARLREEMEGVRRLQESIIPHGIVMPPGYRIAARYEPSQVSVVGDQPVVMAGGDYYNVFQPDARTLIVLIGDASGHGLKACMSIMAMHTLIRMLGGDRYRDTAEFVTEINERLCENSIVQGGGGFITLLYAAVDVETHVMEWTTAGHPLPLLHHSDGDGVRAIGDGSEGGLPLGVAAGIPYDSARLTLPPGGRVLLYTDGLADSFPMTTTAGHAAFGVDGITAALRASRGRSPEQTLQQLFEASNAFTLGAGRVDDTSVVLVERTAE